MICGRVCLHEVMNPRCTVQLVHLELLGSIVLRNISRGLVDELEGPSLGKASSSLSPGYGMYSWGTVDRSIMVLVTEYVPRKATIMRRSDGGWDKVMYPQLSDRRIPVFHV